jgi:type IV secretion system protein TrbL
MGVCDVPVVSGVCDQAGHAAASLASAPFDWLATAMGGAAAWMFETVWSVFDSTTHVDLTNGEYTRVYNLLFGVAVFLMLGFFLLQVLGGMVRREPAALSRAAFGLAKSILGSFVALALVATALEVTDQLCVGIVHAAGTNLDQMGDRIALLAGGLTTLNIAAPGAGAIVTIFLAGLAIGAAVLVWISLLVRKALLLIAIVFAPLALAGSSWDHTRTWVSRWATFVIALIVSKVVVVVIFLLATTQVSAPIDAGLQSASEPIAGVALMLIAGFAPYLAYKAISFMGFDMYHAMSAEQEAKAALNRPLPIPISPRSGVSPAKILDGINAANRGGADPSPAMQPPTTAKVIGGAPAATNTAGADVATGAATAATGAGPAGAGAAAGLVAAKEAVATGPRIGALIGGTATEHTDGASQNGGGPSLRVPAHVAEQTLPSPSVPAEH